jgi:hypothetical protein
MTTYLVELLTVLVCLHVLHVEARAYNEPNSRPSLFIKHLRKQTKKILQAIDDYQVIFSMRFIY